MGPELPTSWLWQGVPVDPDRNLLTLWLSYS